MSAAAKIAMREILAIILQFIEVPPEVVTFPSV
jgi:hypothetical protein